MSRPDANHEKAITLINVFTVEAQDQSRLIGLFD
jgi:hypothetical protein